MPEYAIGVDLGGTNLRAAAIARTGETLAKISGRAQFSQGRDTVVADMVSSIRTLRDQCGAHQLAGVGVGVAGFILMEKGMVLGSNNLPSFENFEMRAHIEQLLGTPVVLENDANAAAAGERWMGAGRGVDDLVLITLGTGIGGGIISGGKVLRGFLGMAGELGHMTVVPNGTPCGCGNHGCLEKHASAVAITTMARMLQLGDDLTAHQVYDLAVAGNEKARRVFVAMGEALGMGLANLINIFNFPLYLLSGGVLAAWELFTPAMFEEIKRRSFTFLNSETRIEKASLGDEAGLFGAAWLGGGGGW
jgi:glucokinase